MSDADGTYSFAYSGDRGVGIGVFTIQNNLLKGADIGGGRYSGTVGERPDGQGYNFLFDMFVPAGTFLVQGTEPQEIPHTRGDLPVDLPLDFFNGQPITRAVGPGKVTFMIRRIPDELAWYASGVKATFERVEE